MKLTKEQLKDYRQQGYSYKQIAKETGYCEKAIYYRMRKYGLTNKNSISEEEKALFCELRQQGKSVKEIAELSGRSQTGVYGFLKTVGLGSLSLQKDDFEKEDKEAESIVFTPIVVNYAEERKPQAVRCVAEGKIWWDVSDFWIPR